MTLNPADDAFAETLAAEHDFVRAWGDVGVYCAGYGRSCGGYSVWAAEFEKDVG